MMGNLTLEKNSGLDHGKDQNDFEALAQPFQNRLYRTALILTKSPSRARELVQVTFLKAKQQYHELKQDGDLSIWLAELMVNYYSIAKRETR